MIEAIAVCFLWVSKWLKSGKTNHSRRLGFWMSIIVSCVWIVFFWQSAMYWLSVNSIVTVFISSRGVRNNKETFESVHARLQELEGDNYGKED